MPELLDFVAVGGRARRSSFGEAVNLPPMRDYQSRAHSRTCALLAAGRDRVLNVAPCGAGKTRLGLEHVADFTRSGRSALWVAPGKDLVRQPVERLLAEGWDDVAWIADGRRQGREGARLTVATVQGLEALAAAGKPLPEADLVVLDEARSYATPGRVALLDRWPGAARIGYDASPIGPGGGGLAMLFRELVMVAQPGELIAAGHLAPYVVRAPKAHQPELAADPVTAWRNCTRPGGELTFAYCRDVAHAVEMAAAFRRAGVRAEHLEGKHSSAHRARVLLDFLEGRITVLASAIMLRQGVDIPPASCVLVARAALSLSLWVQMTGRGGRPKERCLVIDLHGAVHLHGHPADPRAWSLEGEAVRQIDGLPPCRQCSACLAWWPGDGGACPACGSELLPAPRAPVRVKASDLIEVFASDSPEQKARTLVRFVGEAWLSGLAKGKTGRDLIKAGWSGAYRWAAKYPDMGRPPPRDVARAMRDTGIARLVLMAWGRVLGLCSSEGEDDMSRGKSGALKAAARPKSDAGHAGWRPRVDMAASMQINGLRPAAVPVEPKPIEPPPLCECDPRLPARDRCNKSWVRCNAGIRARRHLEPVFPTAAEAPEIHEDRERTERLDPQETPRRMMQPGLFDALGVKV